MAAQAKPSEESSSSPAPSPLSSNDLTTCSALPRYWRKLIDPRVKTIFVTGCGGGFDFVHSGTLIPELLRQGKEIVIGSFSFGDATQIQGGRYVWEAKTVTGEVIKIQEVDASCRPPRNYAPEVGMCRFLDERFPNRVWQDQQPFLDKSNGPATAEQARTQSYQFDTQSGIDGATAQATERMKSLTNPWKVYAYNGRQFTPSFLRHFHRWVIERHSVDAILIIDGGSDSLMRGDEAGLGDPIEDAVSVVTVATIDREDDAPDAPAAIESPAKVSALNKDNEMVSDNAFLPLTRPIIAKVLIAIGVGCDRFNEVSDGATLRAMAELTAMRCDPKTKESGFLGSMALEPDSLLSKSYTDLIEYLQNMAHFRSVIANCICIAAAGGYYGSEIVPPMLRARVRPGELFLWPLMGMHFAFDPEAIMQRSLLCKRLLPTRTVVEMYNELSAMRKSVEVKKWEKLL